MDSVIISSIIEAISLIAVAFIGTKGVNKAIKEKHFEGFDMFSSKEHNYTLLEMLLNAKHDVYIVAAIGNGLFKEYKHIFSHLIEHGIKIHVLIQTEAKLNEQCDFMDSYSGMDERNSTIDLFTDLKIEQPDCFEWREIDSFMTVSCIGIDIDVYTSSYYKDSSIIQVMLYLWKTSTEKCTITYINPQTEKKQYEILRKSILEMWEVGK